MTERHHETDEHEINDEAMTSHDMTQIILEIEDVQDFLNSRIDDMNKALRSFDEDMNAQLAEIKSQAQGKLKTDFMRAMLDLQDEVNEIASMNADDMDTSLKSLAEGVMLTQKEALKAAGVDRVEDAISDEGDAPQTDSVETKADEDVKKVKPVKRGRRNLGAMMKSAQASFDPFKDLDKVRERVQSVIDMASVHRQEDENVALSLGKLEEQLERFEKLAKGHEDKKSRLDKEKDNAKLYGAEKLAKKFIEVVDNMDRALQATEQHKDNEAVSSLYTGVASARTKLVEAFAANGVERDDPLGDKLNPHRHQAVAMLPKEGAEKDEIINVSASGYVMRDRVIRPAMVVVAA